MRKVIKRALNPAEHLETVESRHYQEYAVQRDELPETVRYPDGRTEPFEPERITRSLFAAGERTGRPDAFLARELTESALHFLGDAAQGSVTTPEEIAEIVIKVVRELGQPELARAYAERDATAERTVSGPSVVRPFWPEWMRGTNSPGRVLRAAASGPLEQFSLNHVFPRELVHAHLEGLLRLTGLEEPLEMAGLAATLGPGAVLDAIYSARHVAGQFLAVDGPEFDLALQPGDRDEIVEAFLHDVRVGGEVLGFRMVLNLNCATPPPRLASGGGPLFTSGVDGRERRREMARLLADRAAESCLTIWWHVAPDSSDVADVAERVPGVLAGRSIEFVFDRPRQPIALAPGIDRETPATLLQVGVNLARLVELMGGAPVDPTAFLAKVASLTRFAKTAGHAKQDFLRRHARPAVREAFLLERSRLVLVPHGLAEALRATDRPATEFGREIIKTMRAASEQDRPRRMPVQVLVEAAGEAGISAGYQIRTASPLHAASGAGSLEIRPAAGRFDDSEIIDAINAAAQSSIGRLRFAVSYDERSEAGSTTAL